MMSGLLPATLPFFIVLFVGIIAGYTRKFVAVEPALNAFVYYIAMPAFLFGTIAGTSPGSGVPAGFFLVALGVTAGITVGAYALAALVPQLRRLGPAPVALAAGYGNVGYLGVPIVLALLGPAGALAAAFGQLLHNTMFMIGYPLIRSVAAARDGAVAGRSHLLAILNAAVFRNPVTLSVATGLIVAFARVKVTGVLGSSIAMLGQAAVPGALFAIGLTFRGAITEIRRGGIPPLGIGVVTAIKLLVLPAATVAAVWLCGASLPGLWGRTAVIMAATPVSATAFVLSQEYDGDGRFLAITIVATTVLALVTIPAFGAIPLP